MAYLVKYIRCVGDGAQFVCCKLACLLVWIGVPSMFTFLHLLKVVKMTCCHSISNSSIETKRNCPLSEANSIANCERRGRISDDAVTTLLFNKTNTNAYTCSASISIAVTHDKKETDEELMVRIFKPYYIFYK